MWIYLIFGSGEHHSIDGWQTTMSTLIVFLVNNLMWLVFCLAIYAMSPRVKSVKEVEKRAKKRVVPDSALPVELQVPEHLTSLEDVPFATVAKSFEDKIKKEQAKKGK